MFIGWHAEKTRELGTCQSEIKALTAAEVQKDKAIEEVLTLFLLKSIFITAADCYGSSLRSSYIFRTHIMTFEWA